MVPDEPPATAIHDRRAPHPACAVRYPPVGRTPLDAAPVWADSQADQATHVASDLVESTGHRGRKTGSGSIPAGVSLRAAQGARPGARGVSRAGRSSTPWHLCLPTGRHAWVEGARLTQQRTREETMGPCRESRLRGRETHRAGRGGPGDIVQRLAVYHGKGTKACPASSWKRGCRRSSAGRVRRAIHNNATGYRSSRY